VVVRNSDESGIEIAFSQSRRRGWSLKRNGGADGNGTHPQSFPAPYTDGEKVPVSGLRDLTESEGSDLRLLKGKLRSPSRQRVTAEGGQRAGADPLLSK